VSVDNQIANLGGAPRTSVRVEETIGDMVQNVAVITYVPKHKSSRTGLGFLYERCGYDIQTFLDHYRDIPSYFPKCAKGIERAWSAINDIMIYVDPSYGWSNGIVDATEVGNPQIVYDLDDDPNGILRPFRTDGKTVYGTRLSTLVDLIERDRIGEGSSAEGHPYIYIHVLTSFA
jgi:hypothetical protein